MFLAIDGCLPLTLIECRLRDVIKSLRVVAIQKRIKFAHSVLMGVFRIFLFLGLLIMPLPVHLKELPCASSGRLLLTYNLDSWFVEVDIQLKSIFQN